MSDQYCCNTNTTTCNCCKASQQVVEDLNQAIHGEPCNPYPFKHLQKLDHYRVLREFGVVDPCLQDAVFLLLSTGNAQDPWEDELVEETIRILNRYLDMQAEDREGAAVRAG